MSREAIIFILGALVILVPFLGIPDLFQDRLLIVVGVVIMVCGYTLRRSAFLREIESERGDRVTDSFSEYIPQTDTD